MQHQNLLILNQIRLSRTNNSASLRLLKLVFNYSSHNADVMLTIKNGAQQTTNIMNTIPITLDAFCSVWTSSVFMLAALSSS
jgi:hypothetical protein